MNDKPTIRDLVQQRCQTAGFGPNTQLGQHFLVEPSLVDTFCAQLSMLPTIEIGAGPGQLSEAIAAIVPELVCLEIDRRYEKVLAKVLAEQNHVKVVVVDALEYRYDKPQIVGNLPFHISEPFLQLLTRLNYVQAVLIVGKALANILEANLDSEDFSQLSLLSKVFFKFEKIKDVPATASWPAPRTDSAIVKIIPVTKDEAKKNLPQFLIRGLFLSASTGTLIKNCLKEGLIAFKEPEKLTQNAARAILANLKINQEILQKPFQQLSNLEIRELAKATFDQAFISQVG